VRLCCDKTSWYVEVNIMHLPALLRKPGSRSLLVAALARASILVALSLALTYVYCGNLNISIAISLFFFVPLNLGLIIWFTGWKAEKRDAAICDNDSSEVAVRPDPLHAKTIGTIFVFFGLIFSYAAVGTASYSIHNWSVVPYTLLIACCSIACFLMALRQFRRLK